MLFAPQGAGVETTITKATTASTARIFMKVESDI
jgi:hypothetical protein